MVHEARMERPGWKGLRDLDTLRWMSNRTEESAMQAYIVTPERAWLVPLWQQMGLHVTVIGDASYES